MARSFSARWIGLAATLVAASGLALDVPGERTRWVTLRTPHFTLYSDGVASKTHEVAIDLERMVAAVGKSMQLDVRLEPPVKVFLFGSGPQFEDFCGSLLGRACTNIGGLFQPGPHASYLLMPVRRFEDAGHVAQHELTHALIRSSSPWLPLWLDEGIAEFHSTFLAVGSDVRTGRLHFEHLATLRRTGFMPTARMLAVDHESPEYTTATRRDQFYAQAWLSVHYILLAMPDGRRRLDDFLTRRRHGEPDESAFQSAFGMPTEEFTKELNGYRQRPIMPEFSLPATALAVGDPGHAAPLPRDAALCALAQMLLECQNCDPRLAQPFLDEAGRLNSNSARQAALLGQLAAKQGHSEEASSLFTKAAQVQPADATALLLAGEHVAHDAMEEARASGVPPETKALQARELFTRALALEPGSVAARIGLGNTYLLTPHGDLAPGIGALEQALAKAPYRSDAASGLAQLYVRAGKSAQANEVLARYLADSPDNDVRTHLPELLAHLEVDNSNAALSSGDYKAAEAALERALAGSHDEEFRGRIRSRLARVRDTEVYNAAVADYNAGRVHEALEALQRLVPNIADPDLRAEAEKLRDRLAGVKAPLPGSSSREVVEQLPADAGSDHARAARREAENQREVDRYNQAAAMARGGDLVGALQIAEDLAANARNAEVKTAAAGLRDRLRARLAGRG